MRPLAFGAACILTFLVMPLSAVVLAIGSASEALLDYSQRAEDVRYRRSVQ